MIEDYQFWCLGTFCCQIKKYLIIMMFKLHHITQSAFTYRICVLDCPLGYYPADKKRCKKCFPTCETCLGSRSDQCSSCKSGYYLNEETNSCVTNCPDGFYLNDSKFVNMSKICTFLMNLQVFIQSHLKSSKI